MDCTYCNADGYTYHLYFSGYNADGNINNICIRVTMYILLKTIQMGSCAIRIVLDKMQLAILTIFA